MNEAIKKILPGLNLEEDCTSYKVPDHRFFHDFESEEDTEEVEYHPLQFGLSSEQRTTIQPEVLKSATTTSFKKDITSQSTIASTVATHRSNAGFSASTCLVSSRWFSCGVAVSMGEAAKPLLFDGFQAGCPVSL